MRSAFLCVYRMVEYLMLWCVAGSVAFCPRSLRPPAAASLVRAPPPLSPDVHAPKNTPLSLKHKKECIARHDYQERYCVKEIAAIIECCDAVAAAGEPAPVQCSFSSSYRKLVAEAKAAGGAGGGGCGS